MLISTFIFFIFIILLAVVSFFRKHRSSYHQGRITRAVFVGNIFLDILGILLAMIFAGLLSRYLVQVATAQLNYNLIRIVAGIILSILVGASVGLFVNRTWGRLVKP